MASPHSYFSSPSTTTLSSPAVSIPIHSNMTYHRVEKRIYSLVDHLIRTVLYLSLSAVFAGLTIGIMCMDTLTFEIIANSGPEPDRTYASQILPLRRQGHQTLCTLILSNILMNVLVVQEVATLMDIVHELEGWWWIQKTVKGNSNLSGFIISTLVILIFTEIIPMSICKSKYSLRIAAAGCVLARAAMIMAYPIAMPLGKLLDCFVPHGVGQIYDRNELRKLMILHCEAHGDRSGLVRSEMELLIAAMDFHEKKVSDIMSPIENVTTVKADEILTNELIQKLWKSGRSRIPVEQSPNNYVGILLVKDLLTFRMRNDNLGYMTVGELVMAKSRVFASVDVNTSLPTLFRFFQHAKVHMVLVSRDNNNNESFKKNETNVNINSYFCKSNSFGGNNIVGLVTLEDVMEALIQEEIFDEYDRNEYSCVELTYSSMNVVPMELKGVPMPLHEPTQISRVSFCSYLHNLTVEPLTESEVWAVAYYLTRAVNAFFLWHPGYVKMLLDESGDQQLNPPCHIKEGDSSVVYKEKSPKKLSQVVSPFSYVSSESLTTTQTCSLEKVQHVRCTNLISKAMDDRFVLYRNGVQTTMFTLILGGQVDASIGPDNFPFRRCSFEWLAEKALTMPYYVPDFDAVVLYPTRIYQISRERYMRYLSYNDAYTHVYAKSAMLGGEIANLSFHPTSQVSSDVRSGTFSPHYFPKDEKEELLQSLPSGRFYVAEGIKEKEQNFTSQKTNVNGYAAWPFFWLFVIFLVAITLAAMFSGLTIGLFGMDLITLDIVSSAGKEPDSTYAKRILPIRRYGHQLLATLLIGNMLTMVIISQMVSAMVQSTEFVNFILATVIVFVFAEIIPMGICNKGPYALWIGAKSAPVVFVALFLLYPLAKPLGMFLECIVHHDAGFVYDRKELKKLVRIHCEKYAHESGLGYDEMRMIIGALEMKEAMLASILKPLDRVLMLPHNLPITHKLIEQLWICGKSRLPVYADDSRSHITGVLCVKDLINITSEQIETGLSVGDVVSAHSRDIVIVPEMISLYDLLKVFQSVASQLLFVEKTDTDEHTSVNITSTTTSITVETTVSEVMADERLMTTMTNFPFTVLTPRVALESEAGRQIIGIVTLEDMIEDIIKDDIYDEYDQGLEKKGYSERYEEGNNIQKIMENGWNRQNKIGTYEVDHDAWVVPRVNFYSYTVNDEEGDDNILSEEQVVALSNFLLNSCVAFATWTLPRIKCLINHVGDRVVRLGEREHEGPVLYRCGEWSDAFTLLLSGGVRILLCDGGFSTEKRSFSMFGEEALLTEEGFFPDYTAIISRTSRYIRITVKDLLEEMQRFRKQGTMCSMMTNNIHSGNVEERSRMIDEELFLQ